MEQKSKKTKYWKLCISISIIGLSLFFSFDFKITANGTLSSELTAVYTTENNITTTEYYDTDGQLTIASDKGYASVKKLYNDYGQIIEEFYFDESGKPARQSAGQFGLGREYNEAGQNYKIIYEDAEGNPIINSSGYVIAIRKFNAEEQITQELYCDASGNPIQVSGGQYGTKFEYDAKGNQIKSTSIDANGEPLANKRGFASYCRTYNDDGSLNTECYLGINDDPVKVDGAYGVKYIGLYKLYLDQNGNIAFSINNLVQNFPWMIIIFGLLCSLVAVFQSKNGRLVFIIIYIGLILSLTIFNRNAGGWLELTPFWSYRQFFNNYELRIEILKNIWLFVPFGTAIYSLVLEFKLKKCNTEKFSKIFQPRLIVIIIKVIFSSLIEILQFVFSLGLCEFDDVVSNTLGAIIGIIIVETILTMRKRVNWFQCQHSNVSL